ncbi:ROK family protein [Bifidobacterium sp. ESL0690]|uniref:ROK family protein n=1 Tax=Bifidobacterium sp. ESL0690 TaxID=2983214 RepID=UPI0023F9B736|nr:ROK family protein [Bifidobacterium sp. ESL0690]WEV46199.1 ROK family protein [Bifidobacterium sp. ESL0690]
MKEHSTDCAGDAGESDEMEQNARSTAHDAKTLCRPGRYIGIDIGGTKIAGALLDFDSQGVCWVLDTARVPARRGSRQVVQDVNRVVGLLVDGEAGARTEHESGHLESGQGGKPRVAGIGLCIPGRVYPKTGVVENVANLDISRLALTDAISETTGLPAHLENDVNAATLGAYVVFGGRNKSKAESQSKSDVFAFLNLGTGLAAGVLRDGMLDNGFSGVVGEIGHIPVERHRWRCTCGQIGCLETAAGGNAIKRLWPQADPPMPDIIAKAHDAGEKEHETASEVLAAVIGAIADAIDVLALAIDPRIIMIGGGTAKTGAPLVEAIRTELRARARNSPFIASLHLDERIALVDASEPIGCIGAAYAMAKTIKGRA